ncbi:MAG: hypothetical protein HN392_09320 [Anaerolineae bacterium]|jgi:hypothetical protein|nr:hypothetical protein [Anaerolineae bacterium]
MKLSGRFIRPSIIKDQSQDDDRGRTLQWKCIVDPSLDKAFLGNLFRKIDIDEGGFSPGTVFENTKTDAIRTT